MGDGLLLLRTVSALANGAHTVLLDTQLVLSSGEKTFGAQLCSSLSIVPVTPRNCFTFDLPYLGAPEISWHRFYLPHVLFAFPELLNFLPRQ